MKNTPPSLTPHVHCAECYRAIPTGGDIYTAQQAFLTPNQQAPHLAPMVVVRNVPLCDDCFNSIQDLIKQQKAKSKIIVPTPAQVPPSPASSPQSLRSVK